MRIFAHSKNLPTAAWPVLVILMVTLTACQPDFATKTSATPEPSPTQPAPAASATAEQPTSPPQPTLTLALQAPGVPQLLRETAITYPNRLVWSGDGQRLGVFAEGGFTLFNAETLEILATRVLQSPAYTLDFRRTARPSPSHPTVNPSSLRISTTSKFCKPSNPAALFNAPSSRRTAAGWRRFDGQWLTLSGRSPAANPAPY